MTILGISAFYHDSAAALIQDGEILAAVQEERFSRKKHDASFPTASVRYCLEFAGCSLNDLDAIVFYEKPLLKFERLLETYYAFAPRGLRSFMAAMPVWLKEKLFLKKIIWEELGKIGAVDKKKVKLLFPEHHLSHAASAFYPSPYNKAAILTMDGVGEWATGSISLGEGNRITVLKEIGFPHSLGLFYSAFTYYCGFKVNSGEYKLMGLAPYGDEKSERVAQYRQLIKSKLIDLKEDGSLYLDQEYFDYAVGLRMAQDHKWHQLFGIARRKETDPLEQSHCDLALAAQQVLEEAVINLAKEAKRITGADYLCLAGGVALNCVANGKLESLGLFRKLFIQPAAGDAGGALGAALAGYYTYYEKERIADESEADRLKGSYLGTDFTDVQIHSALLKYKATYQKIDREEDLMQKVARLIAAGQVVGWHQGRMEFGPRALGNRSILADARNPDMQKKLNLKIKYREGFRPFAPVVLAEDAGAYFDLKSSSPYMLLVKPIRPERQIPYPEGFHAQNLSDKLYFLRSDLPAVTHVDYSARIQTVHKESNHRLWALLQSFRLQTGCSVMINTSFNVRGEPIVNSPEDAFKCFMRTEMDCLVIGNYILHKDQQLPWKEAADWKHLIEAD
ncbi:carbamoyltransferase [Paraflavitalea sp. CAU 1676]|uniref:carbamoyltransferase family protein n=1 Tax=Paraflavitalea sp. CAU 1676 TaxID=3032598 RepID=UPI0023DBA4BD|nr:carbamoyltransferase [Paraflavitalea sp. CAU 1676]MDF2189772.1 carbamoyltransferase [Paraflavitalea sp. CAU 1676]